MDTLELIIDKIRDRYRHIDRKIHTTDGPVLIDINGNQFWYLCGKIHREDGPAIIWKDGNQEWHFNGKKYFTNREYQNAAGLTDQDMTAIVLKYGNMN